MSDTPRTDARLGWGWNNYFSSAGKLCRELERELNQTNKAMIRLLQERDENKAGWDRASLTALDLEQRLKRAVKCIEEIESQYKSSCGEYYDFTTLSKTIREWRDDAKAPQD